MLTGKQLQKLGFRKVLPEGTKHDWKGETWYRDDISMIIHFDERDGWPGGQKYDFFSLIEGMIEATHELYEYQ